MPTTTEVVTAAVVSPLRVVSHGLHAMLADQREVVLVDPTGPDPTSPDVVLYDAMGVLDGDADELDRLVASGAAVLVVAQDLRPGLAALAVEHGAVGTVALSADAAELVEAIRLAGAGDLAAPTRQQRLGHDVGLTPREIDVLTCITQGMSNLEIAQQRYLSINSVKTYIRSAYRRIEVTSRSQAVVWCLQHGFPTSAAA